MMAEYIEREALLLRIDCHGTNKFGMLDEDIRDFVKAQPVADVAPVVRGRWECNPPTINTYGQLRCSICNWWTLDLSVDCSYSYCPNCGAKMDGGGGNG